MNLKFIRPAALFLFFITYNLNAQINEDLGIWYAYNFKTKFHEKFTLSVDIQSRYNSNKQQLIRGVLGKNFKNNFNLGLGYGYFNNQRSNPNKTIHENRIFQELNFNHTLFTVLKLKHRFRIEERFMSHKDFFMRFRYAISVRYNLFTNKNQTKLLNALVANELFVNSEVIQFEEESELVSYDRNRFLIGMEYVFHSKISLQLAYMEQYLENNKATQIVLKVTHKI
ncbi:MAG: DUF2490 domain-containing protein [Flavobacteriaceae bacterium]